MKQIFNLAIYFILLSLIAGCDKFEDSPANITVSQIDFTETYRNEVLDLPNGSFMPDNPDFDINNSETWTGNMAKYVNHNYIYSVSYTIKNIGYNIAYDIEIDLHYIYDNGDENTETIFIGDISPNESINSSSNVSCTNKQLIGCRAEAVWSD
jgi:hypothetical protein